MDEMAGKSIWFLNQQKCIGLLPLFFNVFLLTIVLMKFILLSISSCYTTATYSIKLQGMDSGRVYNTRMPYCYDDEKEKEVGGYSVRA